MQFSHTDLRYIKRFFLTVYWLGRTEMGKTYALIARKETHLTKDRCMPLQSTGRNRQHFYGIVHFMLK